MAAYDAQASNKTGTDDNGAGQASATLSFTGAAGAALVVQVSISRAAVDLTSTVVTVTYNGVSMTSLKRQVPGSTSAASEIFGLLNACDGSAHNVAVTIASGNQPALIFTGAISATSVGSFSGAVGSAPGILTNSGNLAVTSGGTSDLVIGGGAHGDTISGAGTGTQRWNQVGDAFSAGGNAAGSTVPGAAGTVNVAFTSSVSDHWVLLGVNLQNGAAVAPANIAPVPLFGPGSSGPTGWQWQQIVGSDLGIVSEDHPTSGELDLGSWPVVTAYTHDATPVGLLEIGNWPAATLSRAANVVGLLEHGTWPTALQSTDRTLTASVWTGQHPRATVSHDASVAALIAAGEAIYATVSHDATIVGLVEHGTWLDALITSTADINDTGIGFVGTSAVATVSHNVTGSGLIVVGEWPDATTYSKDSTPTGLLEVGTNPRVGAYSKDVSPVGLIEVGSWAMALVTGSVDISTAGLGFVGATIRSTVSSDRTATGLVELAATIRSTVTTDRTAAVARLVVAAVPVATVTANRTVVALVAFGVAPSGLISPPFVIGIATSVYLGPTLITVLLDAGAVSGIVGPSGSTSIVGADATSSTKGGDVDSEIRIEE